MINDVRSGTWLLEHCNNIHSNSEHLAIWVTGATGASFLADRQGTM